MRYGSRPEIIYYDELHERICSSHDRLYGEALAREGVTFGFTLRPRQGDYIICELKAREGKTRAALLVDKKRGLVFETTDIKGTYHSIEYSLNCEYGKWITIICVVSTGNEGSYMRTIINGVEKTTLIKEAIMTPSFEGDYSVGSKSNQTKDIIFDSSFCSILPKPLSFREIGIFSNLMLPLPPDSYSQYSGITFMEGNIPKLSSPRTSPD